VTHSTAGIVENHPRVFPTASRRRRRRPEAWQPVGRTRELATLRQALDAAGAGRGAGLVLYGGWGMGKTTLLTTLAGHAAPGVLVLSATGIETETGMPFGGLHQLLRPMLPDVRTLPRPQATALHGALGLGENPVSRLHAALGTLTLLTRVGQRGGVLVLVDDAHWLDRPSRDILTFVARRLDGTRIAMVFAAHDTTTARFSARQVPVLQIGALDPGNARDLLDRHVPGIPENVVHRLVTGTAGNPAALLDVVRILDPEHLTGDRALPDPLPCGPRTTHAVNRWLGTLPSTTRRLLLIAAANDSDDLDPVLTAARHLDMRPTAAVPAERAGLLAVTRWRYGFPLPVVRSAIYHAAATSERQAAHRALAKALPADPYRRAWHLAAAAEAPDDSAAAALADATGGHTTHRSVCHVADALERAAYLASQPTVIGRCLVDAAAAAWWSGQRDRAESLLRRVPIPHADTPLRGKLARLSAAILQATSSPGLAVAVLTRTAHQIHGAEPELAGELLALAGQVAWTTDDTATLAAVGLDIGALRLPDHDPLKAIGRRYQRLGAYDLRVATGAGRGDPPTAELWLWHPPTVVPFLVTGPGCETREAHAAAVASLREREATGALPAVLARLAALEYVGGWWVDATANATDGVRFAQRTGQRSVAAHLTAVLAMLAGARGEAARCRELAQSAFGFAIPSRVTAVTGISRWALGLAALGAGDFQAAVREYEEVATAGRTAYHGTLALLVTPDLVEAYRRLGQSAKARRALDAVRRWRIDATTPGPLCGMLRARALLATREAEADRWFQAALAVRTAPPFDAARTELCYGESLRRRRRIREARRHLHAALATFTALAATPWLERTRAELRAAGDNHTPPRDVPSHPLTAQETRIARLAAKGLTNKEIGAQMFLTPGTVRYHLSKVFPKLRITSRHQLRDVDLGDAP
jgi:DNA-binding CsgD family transcriptional regulator